MLVPVLSTERLLLRPFELRDVAALVPLLEVREVAANLLRVPHPYNEQDARTFIGSIQQSNEAPFAIVLPNDTLIGGMGLTVDPAHARAELGYWLGVPHWGHGYATEAARAVLEYGFDTLGLHRIWASHFHYNEVSAKVLRKIGMRHEGRLRQHVLKWGEFIDLEMYGILRTDPKSDAK
jgi:RimJ/RimL family protein N-acetyltransferase